MENRPHRPGIMATSVCAAEPKKRWLSRGEQGEVLPPKTAATGRDVTSLARPVNQCSHKLADGDTALHANT